MKLADITPSRKKDDKCLKENYRPISILSSLSKIFEKHMHADIYKYMETRLSPYLCGFRKGYSTQYCLVVMLEKPLIIKVNLELCSQTYQRHLIALTMNF